MNPFIFKVDRVRASDAKHGRLWENAAAAHACQVRECHI